MRYTKRALLLFGLGLVLGLVVVAGQFAPFERVASTLMAAALVLLPLAVVADRGIAIRAWLAARLRRGKRRKARGKSRPAQVRHKPAPRSPPRAARRRRS